MQIGFYMSPADEANFLAVLRSKSVYLFDYKGAQAVSHPLVDSPTLSRQQNFLCIASEEIMPRPARGAFSKDQLLKDGTFTFEFIEFNRTWMINGNLQPGRFWLNGRDKVTVLLYQKLCLHIRKSYAKTGGFWVGPDFATWSEAQKADHDWPGTRA